MYGLSVASTFNSQEHIQMVQTMQICRDSLLLVLISVSIITDILRNVDLSHKESSYALEFLIFENPIRNMIGWWVWMGISIGFEEIIVSLNKHYQL